jgi:hypothetical protein
LSCLLMAATFNSISCISARMDLCSTICSVLLRREHRFPTPSSLYRIASAKNAHLVQEIEGREPS